MKKQEKQASRIITANQAAAYGAKLSCVQVISAYPITPQSPVVEELISFVEKKEMKAELVLVESEHSAITVCISASATGARVFTASCANGLALMHEQLHWAAGSRLPIVMAIPNRAIAAPWNILNDQQDSISQRDTGWLQIYCRNNQEVLDSIIQAFRIAEKVMAPVMVCYDGYVLSHTLMPVFFPDEKKVKDFLPDYKPHMVLEPGNPKNINPVTLAEPRMNAQGVLCHGYFEFRYMLQEAHLGAIDEVLDIGREYGRVFGREYGLYQEYCTEGADILMVAIGSIASEGMDAVDALREKGYRVGIIHVRLYRPFPARALSEAIRKSGCRGVAVMEKNVSYGYEGALASDLKAALFDYGVDVFAHSYIMGLGGRDVNPDDITEALMESHAFLERPEGQRRKDQKWINCKL